ncbi:MAG TPA: hypothetical protein PLR52_10120 [Bacteroidales bacterium]|nr:hypothetical protein [Bacteroidales bacterium]HPI68577.1 hypothetical protein [Bacteroidales bacterium]HPR73236.1 hypothetical protein [Bacteroidales bacterium]
MQPDRSNYEQWITAWLEGKLSQSEVEQLLSFLEENQDILEKTELAGCECLSVNPVSMPGKDKLKRSAEEINRSQIEYLSVAFLENDITPGQLTDLEQNLSVNPEHRKIFDAIQKTRLDPVPVIYNDKHLLKKPDTVWRLLRYPAIVLSAAATIAILVLSAVFIPRYLSHNTQAITEKYLSGNNAGHVEITAPEVLHETLVINKDSSEASSSVMGTTKSTGFSAKEPLPDSSPAPDTVQAVVIRSTPAISPVTTANLKAAVSDSNGNNILLYNGYINIAANENDQRSNLQQYLAGFFRERILKDEVVTDDPIKSYEVARAGIEGLNRLLGWDMALITTNNEEGDLQSYYFSSGLLKVNIPAKDEKNGL